jgi:hypothetical protein
MFTRRKTLQLLAAGAVMTSCAAAVAQGDSIQAETGLVNKYTAFAGSQSNAIALVGGLRNGAEVALQPAGAACPVVQPPVLPPVLPPVQPPTLPPSLPGGPGGLILPPPPPPPPPVIQPASFTPPTGTMGYGNVDIALDLAQQQLVKAGITQPTPVQLKASFMGGSVTTCAGVKTDVQGILVLRAGKESGWGRIAQRLGLTLSD